MNDSEVVSIGEVGRITGFHAGEVGKVGYIEVEMECKHCGIRYCPHEWTPVTENVLSHTKDATQKD